MYIYISDTCLLVLLVSYILTWGKNEYNNLRSIYGTKKKCIIYGTYRYINYEDIIFNIDIRPNIDPSGRISVSRHRH